MTQRRSVQVPAGVGHRVDLRYLERTARRKRGQTESVILGETRGPEVKKGVSICSAQSALAKALFGAKPGDIVTVQANGLTYKVRILKILEPLVKKGRNP